MIATFTAFKNKLQIVSSQKSILLLSALPLIGIATLISFFKNRLPHWTGPAYTSLILLAACYFSSKKRTAGSQKWIAHKPVDIAFAMMLSIIVSGIILINYYPGTLGKKDKALLGEDDFTLDMVGWNNLKPAVEKIFQNDVLSGAMRKDAVIISNKWFPAAHIDFHVACR